MVSLKEESKAVVTAVPVENTGHEVSKNMSPRCVTHFIQLYMAV
jgi:hypothetical protein